MTVRPTAAAVLAVVAVLLVAAIAWSMRVFSRYQPYAILSGQTQGPTLSLGLVLRDVNLQGHSHGIRSWTFHASQITLSRDRNSASADQLTDGILYQNARPALNFAAGHALADLANGPSTGVLLLTGNVAARTVGNTARRLGAAFAVSAPSLVWNTARGTVDCAGPLRATVGSLGTVIASALHYDTHTKMADIGSFHLVAASQALPSASATPAATSAKTIVHVDAPQGGHWDGQTHTWLMHGHWTFKQEDATVETVGGTYDQKAAFARSQSPVTLKDPQTVLTGQQGTVDFNQHVATLAGDIHLTVKPKPAEKGADTLTAKSHQPAVMTCDQIVYNYRTKKATATGHFVVHQKDRTVTAEKGLYDANAQLVTLDGDVHYSTTDGQSFTATEAVISIKPGNETVDVNGPIKGDFPSNDQDNPIPKH
ncbi:MAG TPA: hypothetical protein VFW40_01805 [Capsulimonadaceae bacterium]|nr:hypothetical protein [Capsulimonadaceae bacterium]